MTSIRVVMFDLGDTLADLGEGRGDYEERVLARAGRIYDLLDAAGLDLPGRGVFSSDLASGTEMRYQQALALHKGIDIYQVLRDLYREMGLAVEPALLDETAEMYCRGGSHATPLRLGARDLLERLQTQGYRLGVISNTIQPGRFLDEGLAQRGILDFFEARIYSSDQGVAKPHPQIFQSALSAFGVRPAQAVYVGDRLEADIIGAHGVGMRAVLVRVPHRPENHFDVQPDARIDTLIELLDVLPSLDGEA